jgi:hypothetical protein
VWVVIACKEKVQEPVRGMETLELHQQSEKEAKESQPPGQEEGSEERKDSHRASGIGVLVCQCNVRTKMPEEKCKGDFGTVNSLKEAQDGSLSEDKG